MADSIKNNIRNKFRPILLISSGVLSSFIIFTRLQVGILFIIFATIIIFIFVKKNFLDYTILKLFLSGVFIGISALVIYLIYSNSLVSYFNQVVLYAAQFGLDYFPFFKDNIYDRFEPRIKDVTLVRFILDIVIFFGLVIIVKTFFSINKLNKNYSNNTFIFLCSSGALSMLSQAYPMLDNSHLWWALPAFIPILSMYNYTKFKNLIFIALSFFILVRALYILFFANSIIKNQYIYRNLVLGPRDSIVESMYIPQTGFDYYLSNHQLITNSIFAQEKVLIFSSNPQLSTISGSYLNSDPYYEIYGYDKFKIERKLDYLLHEDKESNLLIVDKNLALKVLQDLRFVGIDDFTLINSNEYINFYV